ncbi:hypothetical protein BP00DRAFT_254351 [Aspergillus indologenus CBS 114.80]|uniref:Uncharacterized protein n=1 Tax=Aspergillus indologenus CBS 114.80 TaxID=1450541 RepID=A0A2V5IJV7_9EURO|nr:hypothetical protein BP00DRAFT_254351 [Aspergillus indologenus CBS 114.80]
MLRYRPPSPQPFPAFSLLHPACWSAARGKDEGKETWKRHQWSHSLLQSTGNRLMNPRCGSRPVASHDIVVRPWTCQQSKTNRTLPSSQQHTGRAIKKMSCLFFPPWADGALHPSPARVSP